VQTHISMQNCFEICVCILLKANPMCGRVRACALNGKKTAFGEPWRHLRSPTLPAPSTLSAIICKLLKIAPAARRCTFARSSEKLKVAPSSSLLFYPSLFFHGFSNFYANTPGIELMAVLSFHFFFQLMTILCRICICTFKVAADPN
jgi:hypothetical protein